MVALLVVREYRKQSCDFVVFENLVTGEQAPRSSRTVPNQEEFSDFVAVLQSEIRSRRNQLSCSRQYQSARSQGSPLDPTLRQSYSGRVQSWRLKRNCELV